MQGVEDGIENVDRLALEIADAVHVSAWGRGPFEAFSFNLAFAEDRGFEDQVSFSKRLQTQLNIPAFARDCLMDARVVVFSSRPNPSNRDLEREGVTPGRA